MTVMNNAETIRRSWVLKRRPRGELARIARVWYTWVRFSAGHFPTNCVSSDGGEMAAPGEWHPERYRDLLCMLARQIQLDPRLRRRFDSSDLVQEALLKATQNLDSFAHGYRTIWFS